MSDQPLTAADAALRERITELSVHIPCGGLRGPVQRTSWQCCRHEDSPQKWEGVDVSRHYDLCIVCFRATAGGISRWSWLACADCRSVNDAIAQVWGFRPFALGRHSLMNAIGLRGGASPKVQQRQAERLSEFAGGDWRLKGWRDHEYRLMAARFEPDADVPLREWQQAWPPGPAASREAFAQLIGPTFPLGRP